MVSLLKCAFQKNIDIFHGCEDVYVEVITLSI